MKQTNSFKILGKKYQRNLQFKVNTVYFEYNGKKFEIQVLYIKNRNRYAFVQSDNQTIDEYNETLATMGLDCKERKEEFVMALQKYSKLGKMKEWD